MNGAPVRATLWARSPSYMSEAAESLPLTLRAVATALNLLLPVDKVPQAAALSTKQRWTQYVPNQRLVVVAETVAEASDPEATILRIADRALASLSDAA